MKKTFDAVAVMREARQKLTARWENKSRAEEIESLRRKYADRTKKKKLARS